MMTEVTPQGEDTDAEESVAPAQYRKATPRRLGSVPTHPQSKLSAAQGRYKSYFDRKVGFRLVFSAGDFGYLDRLPRALIETDLKDPERLDGSTAQTLHSLLQRSEGPYCSRAATERVGSTVQDGPSTSVSIDCVTKVPTRRRAAQSSAASGGEDKLEAAIIKAATGGALPYRTRMEPIWAERVRISTSSKNSSGKAARRQAYNIVLGGSAKTFRRTHTSAPSCYRSSLLTGTGERFRKATGFRPTAMAVGIQTTLSATVVEAS